MLKGRILGIFCWICLFSECFLSIRDVVWLWTLLVGRLWTLLVERLWTLLVGRLWALFVGRLWALFVERLWTLLVLESFLEGFGMLESEYSLLEKRK